MKINGHKFARKKIIIIMIRRSRRERERKVELFYSCVLQKFVRRAIFGQIFLFSFCHPFRVQNSNYIIFCNIIFLFFFFCLSLRLLFNWVSVDVRAHLYICMALLLFNDAASATHYYFVYFHFLLLLLFVGSVGSVGR